MSLPPPPVVSRTTTREKVRAAMLAISHVDQGYVDHCRSQIAQQVSTYQELVCAAREESSKGAKRLDAAIAAFESGFFNNLVGTASCVRSVATPPRSPSPRRRPAPRPGATPPATAPRPSLPCTRSRPPSRRSRRPSAPGSWSTTARPRRATRRATSTCTPSSTTPTRGPQPPRARRRDGVRRRSARRSRRAPAPLRRIENRLRVRGLERAGHRLPARRPSGMTRREPIEWRR